MIGTIRNVRIPGPSSALLPDVGPFDVFLAVGVIADIAPVGAIAPRGEVLDADGAWLLPGLWDHHVHVGPWSLQSVRVDLAPVRSAAEAVAVMGHAPVPPDARRVGAGYRDAFWPDRPTLAELDAATGEVPTYLVNADVHSVWINSAAARREQMAVDASGILREEPAFEISRRLAVVGDAYGDHLVDRMAREAATRGVVGIVDLDMAWSRDGWMRRAEGGFDALRVEFGVYPHDLDRAIADGLRSGDRLPGSASDLIRVGPFKVISDGSLGTRTAACSHPYAGTDDHGVLTIPPDLLQPMMTAATGAGIACAVHAIGDVANSHALDAFALTGARGTVEHAQLVSHADIPRFARLGVGASVQPVHAVDDRELSDRLWAGQTAIAYPLRELADAGANLLLGSDAPVSALDPWAQIAAAVSRSAGDEDAWHPEQAVDATTAIAASTHGGSTAAAAIEPGAAADLILCADDPYTATSSGLRGMRVLATMIAGRLTHSA